MQMNIREITTGPRREWHVTASSFAFDGERGIAYIEKDAPGEGEASRPYSIQSTPPSGCPVRRQRSATFAAMKQAARRMATEHFKGLARGQS